MNFKLNLICAFLCIYIVKCNVDISDELQKIKEEVPSGEKVERTQEGTEKTDSKVYLPEHILDAYEEYQALEDLKEATTCDLKKLFDMASSDEELLKALERKQCIPSIESMNIVLSNGWQKSLEYIVKEMYLVNSIDPTAAIFNYLNKNENSLKFIKLLLEDIKRYNKLSLSYEFENLNNEVKFNIMVPDGSFIPEYFSIFCYKDMLKIHGIFLSRRKWYRIEETKKLFDVVGGECSYNYNNFSSRLEISFPKENKLRVWNTLFK